MGSLIKETRGPCQMRKPDKIETMKWSILEPAERLKFD